MSVSIRHLHSEELRRALPQMESLAKQSARADANPPFSDQTWVELADTGSGAQAWLADDAGTPVGLAALLTGTDALLAELTVVPSARGQGTGAALANDVVEAAHQLQPKELNAWAHGGSPAAAALATRHSMRPVRDLWRMRLDTDGELDLPAMGPVTIRAFVPGKDDAALLRVNADAFSNHPEQGNMSQGDLDARKAEDWFDPEGLLLAVNDQDQILAFHWTKIDPAATDDAGNQLGEVYVVAVSPQAQGKGLGTRLTIAGINWMVRAGLRHIMLYVDADNEAAVALYQRLGFSLFSRDVMYSTHG